MNRVPAKLNEISVFFPCYNEEKNIVPLLRAALKVLPEVSDKFEIIVVNDGSTDSTSVLAHAMSASYPFIRVIDQKNKGYGGAIKTGFRSSKYEWIFFTDGDMQFNLEDLHKLIEHADANSMVIGYRIGRADGILRLLLAKALKIWNRLFLGFPTFVKDIDCAFKLIHKNVILDTEPLFSNGAMITTELLLKAYRKGYGFVQIGVQHYSRKHGRSTGSNLRVIFKAVKETILLRNGVNETTYALKTSLAATK